jgi:hypothetical protein
MPDILSKLDLTLNEQKKNMNRDSGALGNISGYTEIQHE